MRYLVALEVISHTRKGDETRIHRWTRGRIYVEDKSRADKLCDLLNQHRHEVFGPQLDTRAKICVQINTSRGSITLDHDAIEDLVQDYITSPDYTTREAAE